jgi:hypothetical protein
MYEPFTLSLSKGCNGFDRLSPNGFKTSQGRINKYNLQRQGYGNAFNDAGLQSAVASFAGGIAVTYIEWPGSTQQSV